MTVGSEIPIKVYNCDGVTKQWPYLFTIIATTDIRVYLTDPYGVKFEITSGFTVDTVLKKVIYPVDPLIPAKPTGWIITLERDIPDSQENSYRQNGVLDARTIESGLDKVTMLFQQIKEKLKQFAPTPVTEIQNPRYISERSRIREEDYVVYIEININGTWEVAWRCFL